MSLALDDHLLGNFKEEDFEFYKSFHRREDAMPYVDLLKENDIPFRLEGTDVLITEAIVGTPIFPKIILKILTEDFKKVNGIIEKTILANKPDIFEHYLNDSTDRELLELLKKPDESTIEEVIITKEILKSRGIPIDPAALENMKQERLEELQKGKSIHLGWATVYILLFSLISIFLNPLVMLIAGLGMGYFYWNDKSVDIDGNKYHTFDNKTRTFGYFLLIVTGIVIIVLVLIAIFFGKNLILPAETIDNFHY
ncbi:MAG: hypothetical protein AAF573_06635 [Bacteroidota bacterium]